MTDGEKKFQEVGAKLKADVEKKEEQEKEELQEVKNQLEAVRSNPALAKMYSDNAKVGADNLGGSLPLLKVYAAGRSESKLSDGSDPRDGAFFYKPTQEQFDELTVHILTISKGFRAKGLNGKENVFHQIMGGCILEGSEFKPFIMYLTGLKLSNMWDFGKEANQYTHAKPVPIPMFALTVKLTTEKITNSYGKSWLVNFEIVKDSTGFPKIVTDEGEFRYLKNSADTVEATISSLIDSKSSAEDIEKAEAVDNVEEESEPTPF